MRLDRLITLNLIRPLLRVQDRPPSSVPRLPVLMYHSISNRDESHLRDYFKVCTAPDRFRLQMQTLRDHGYVGVDLESGLAGLEAGSPKANRMVAITFDDGFRDFYTEALPVLAEFGFTATMYLPTAFIGDSRRCFSAQNRSVPPALRSQLSTGPECLTWSEVKEARQVGMRFGSHTVKHPRLYELPWAEIESELRDSRLELEERLQEPILSFAYPYAFPQSDRDFSKRLVDVMAESGYRTGVTTLIGRASLGDNEFLLKRLPVNSCDDGPFLRAKLEGGYDWIASFQRAVKSARSFSHQRSPSLGRG